MDTAMKTTPYTIRRPECKWASGESCSLMLYGGAPEPIHCAACVANRENNPEFADRLFGRVEKTHPPNVRRVSGCCDDARNP